MNSASLCMTLVERDGRMLSTARVTSKLSSAESWCVTVAIGESIHRGDSTWPVLSLSEQERTLAHAVRPESGIVEAEDGIVGRDLAHTHPTEQSAEVQSAHKEV